MNKLLNKKVNWLGKCALCKKEHTLCKCGFAKDLDGGMGTTTTDLMMGEVITAPKSKSTPVFVKKPPSLGRTITRTIGLTKKTKKSENFIDLKNENIPEKRIKNVGGAGYTPGEKKSVKIKLEGSGGFDKNEKELDKGGPGSGPHTEGHSIKGVPSGAKNYTHLLPAAQKMKNYRLFAHHDPKTNHTHSFLTNRNRVVGQHTGNLGKHPTTGKTQYQVAHTKLAGGHNEGMSSALHTAALDHAISHLK